MKLVNNLSYRKEIDGLRAIAVLSVIFFHAGFPFIEGGYIGVDVFFVISGYLITSIILKDLQNKRFSLINFYERRARRILPALFIVILFCIPFTWYFMLPYQIIEFARGLKFVSLFLSNIYFWRAGGDGYFSPKIDEMPLLHTWSLGIEEQFYFIFPLFLILFWKFNKKIILNLLILFLIFSLLISEWGWRNEPIANFYITPSRAWELLSGSILAFLSSKKTFKNNFLSFFGLLLIFFSIFYFDKDTPFPSLYTLVPIIGTCLVILYTNEKTLAYKFLSLNLLVGIGLISYSAYLWHQPLFVFTKSILIEKPSNLILTSICFLSLFFGFVSWKYIESPFRNKNNFTRKKIFFLSIISLIIPIIIGQSINTLWGSLHLRTSGLGNTYKHYGYNWNNPIYEGIGYLNCDNGFNLDESCGFASKNKSNSFVTENIIWGDSFAQHGINFVNEFENTKFSQITHFSCLPLIDDIYKNKLNLDNDLIKKCKNFNEETINYILNNNSIKQIVIGSRFKFLENMNEIEVKNSSITFAAKLNNISSKLHNIDIKIFPPPPQPNYDVASCVNRLIVHGYDRSSCNFKLSDLNKLSQNQKIFINGLKKEGLNVYPLNELLCPDNLCKALIGDIRVFLDDNGHLRNEASAKLGQMLKDLR